MEPGSGSRSALGQAALELAARDALMAELWRRFGEPLRGRLGFDPGRAGPLCELDAFGVVAEIVVYQQLSAAAARSIVERLERRGALRAEGFSSLGRDERAELGLSQAKLRALEELARAVLEGRLDLERLGELDDRAARSWLLGFRGIGPWTADMVLLFHLDRLDVWPTGDAALRRAVVRRFGPTIDPNALGERWRPWRSLAALWLWQDDHQAWRSGLRASAP
jgi:DNA-3-methyladenine glycosylase II